MRFLILAFLSLFALASFSQDVIILRNGEQIDCKITRVDSAIIHYDFVKGERKLSSYVAKNEVRSYKINPAVDVPEDLIEVLRVSDNAVIIDTTEYVKETGKWINLLTYSRKFGLNADGWSLQYYGYNLKNTSKWIIPVYYGIQGFSIHTDYFSQFNYQSAIMNYYLIGVSPFYKLRDTIFLKIGGNLIFGGEKLTNLYGAKSSNTFFGFSPSQGIYFIPKSKVGIIVGLSVSEKVLSSKVYKNDIGISLEAGIKF